MNKPTFSVITPCRNAERLLADTMVSVLQQSALISERARLQYLVMDGASVDATVQVAKTVGGNRVQVTSEPDTGMYDALARGFEKISGDIVCYLNAGDMLAPTAFDVVLDVIQDRPSVRWLTGYDAYFNNKGAAIGFRLPFRYRRQALLRGIYGTVLPTIQQESTFWVSDLLAAVDLNELRRYKLAGDHYLWTRFAGEAPLYVVAAFLGGFRYHGNHLSESRIAYRDELNFGSMKPGLQDYILAYMDKLIWHAPDRLKQAFNPRLLKYDRQSGKWT